MKNGFQNSFYLLVFSNLIECNIHLYFFNYPVCTTMNLVPSSFLSDRLRCISNTS